MFFLVLIFYNLFVFCFSFVIFANSFLITPFAPVESLPAFALRGNINSSAGGTKLQENIQRKNIGLSTVSKMPTPPTHFSPAVSSSNILSSSTFSFLPFSSYSSSVARHMSLRTDTGRTLQGLVRGHKCLFNDAFLSNGNIVFLVRGADSAQRCIYPLELQSNSAFLPGADPARLMFDLRDDALNFVKTKLTNLKKEQKKYDEKKSGGEENSEIGGDGWESIIGDIETFHRILQYATATNTSTDFLHPDVLSYYEQIYSEEKTDYDTVVLAVESLKEFYSEKMPEESFKSFFEPCANELICKINQMRCEEGGVAQESRTAEGESNAAPPPLLWEKTPEEGTLPKLYVDFNNIENEDIDESMKSEIMNFLASRRKEVSAEGAVLAPVA